jgi:hypothetical protein
MPSEEATRSVVQVTAGGRGFVVQGDKGRKYIVTAAHCLPSVPPAHPSSYLMERTYQALIGPLGDQEPEIWAECLFIDPVSDTAVLGEPDMSDLGSQWEEYDDFVEQTPALPMRLVQDGEEAWLLALSGERWIRCKACYDSVIWVAEAEEPFRRGMSGSPIMGTDGHVIGVFCVSAGDEDLDNHREGGPNPSLAHLPGWLLQETAGVSLSSRTLP